MKRALIRITLCAFMLPAVFSRSEAQDGLTCDSLFNLARNLAFEHHDYNTAISRCKEALIKCPDYSDISNFLGRVYIWSHFPDSARRVLLNVLARHPDNEETILALVDLENWNDHPAQALTYCETGLKSHPGSKALLLKKAKLLTDQGRYKEAAGTTDTLLKLDPGDAAARMLAVDNRFRASKNQVSVYYDFVYFDKQFDAPWHLASIEYKRQTAIGPVIGRLNYANRFGTNGVQGEIDAYPHLSRMFYSYLNAGYSNDVGVFPHYRAGFSLYGNFPKSFEGEAGFRYLYFSSSTWIYTFSIGKYYRNFWFNLRSYLTPGQGSTSQSLFFTTRYYYGDADDYWSFGAGTGISPDDRSNNIQLNEGAKLKSDKVMAGYNHAIKKVNVLFITATWLNQEYLPHVRGNQVDIGIGYQKRF